MTLEAMVQPVTTPSGLCHAAVHCGNLETVRVATEGPGAVHAKSQQRPAQNIGYGRVWQGLAGSGRVWQGLAGSGRSHSFCWCYPLVI